MKQRITSLCFFFLSFLHAQNTPTSLSEYFQQQVNYTISVTLNDKEHSLKGFEELEYTNHSSDTLHYIYFHLWPNAYKNNQTCLAKQFLQLGEKSFYFSKPEERGFMDSLNFQINGTSCQWKIDNDTIDIAIVYLNEPLLPNQSIKISTPFYVKIPNARFSRLGHTGNAYYITQWYPKPAVYDRYGWHPMPYLHNGEFYSEFGSFDVSITVPENYVVAATGNRIDDEKENTFIQKRIELTKRLIEKKDTAISNQFPPSSKTYKTVRFVESNVHDFAWFADKRFLILNDEIELFDSKKKVKTWLYFTPANLSLWKDALEYINEATLFLSYYVGDYPYNNVSAVDGSTAAGGGMEYPTITLINQSNDPKQLEEIIVHEVAHNWFYGILASNERDFPAMDEGLVSFYEMRYLSKKYPDLKLAATIGLSDLSKKDILGLYHLPQRKYYEWAYLLLASHNADLPILQHSTKYTELNYAGTVYCKTAVVTDYLKNFFGEEVFDEAMAFYFKTFKFKHPYPQDLKILLDYFGGGDNIPLIENLTMTNKKIDYKISHIKKNENNIYEVTIKNKGQFTAPVVVQAIKDNKVISEIWKTNITKKETFSFPPLEADYFRIDYNEIMPERNRRNNTIRTKGLFKKTNPLQLNFIWKADHFYKTQLHFSPVYAWNKNDGSMLGLAFYNYGIFPKKIEGFIAPMYAFNSKTVVGSADIYVNLFPKNYFKIFQIGLASKSYSYFYSNIRKSSTQYLKLEPYINIQFQQKNPLNKQHHYLTLRSVLLSDRNTQLPLLPSSHPTYNWMNEYVYTYDNTHIVQPHRLELKLQHNDFFLKSSLTFSGKLYSSRKRYWEYRIFAGKFLGGKTIYKTIYGTPPTNNTPNYQELYLKSPYAFRPSGYSNTQDYLMDYYYLGRNQGDVFYRQQFVETEGNLKTWTALGYSIDWLGAINLYSPFFKGFRVFADLVVTRDDYPRFFPNASRSSLTQSYYDAGIQYSLGNINVYFPILMSKELYDNLILNGLDKWYHRIRFSINISRFNPRFEATKKIE